MGGVVDEYVDTIQRFGDRAVDRHAVRVALPCFAEVHAGRRPRDGGDELEVVRGKDRFGDRSTGPTGRTGDTDTCWVLRPHDAFLRDGLGREGRDATPPRAPASGS
jgi:hypothetical protein